MPARARGGWWCEDLFYEDGEGDFGGGGGVGVGIVLVFVGVVVWAGGGDLVECFVGIRWRGGLCVLFGLSGLCGLCGLDGLYGLYGRDGLYGQDGREKAVAVFGGDGEDGSF